MKIHFDIEKLEKLPYRERFWEKDHYVDYSRAYPKQAKKILKASIGRPMDSLKRRIEPLLFGIWTWEYFISSWTEPVIIKDGYYQTINNRWEYINWGDYYVDLDNRLQRMPEKPYKKNKTSTNNFKKEQHRRYKIQRKEQIKKELILLSMINIPKLLYFYTRLLDKREEYQTNLKEIRYRGLTSLFGYYQNKVKSYESSNNEEMIIQLESGNFECFYKSNEYLFSQYKECPHFEQIIKPNI